MNSKTCREVRREIDESDLRLRLSGEVVTHVASCAPCHQFQQERSQLRELVGSLEPVTAPPDFDMRLRARIAAERQRPARASLFSQFLVSTPAMAAAALVVVLAASVIWFSQRNRSQSPVTASESSKQLGKSSEGGLPVKSETTAPLIASNYPENPSTAGGPDREVPRAVNRRTNDAPLVKTRSSAGDFDVKPAMTISRIVDSPGEVSLSAPDKPLVVSVEDDSGARRNISLPAVSFGSQRLVDNRVPVSTNGRVW
jgi:hypothetical protein